MGNYLILERFVWFDRQVKAERYPNAGTLAEHFELSRKTAQRGPISQLGLFKLKSNE